jgi:ubiquinone/menaquinone biosynthesis C-methylase UbiE/short-subunit dehydrogenase/acyl carrier protein
VRFRELLDQAGLFSRTDMGFTASDSELQTRLEQLCAAHPLLQAELELVAHAGQSLPQVLRGELNALDVLFSDRGGASRVYHESATMRVLNRQIVIALQKILTELPPSQGVRILEIGAGTGATTAEVATRLPSERVEYCFTDLSPAFLVSAREKFSHCRFMQFRELDIEQPPVDQGFAERSFDVVIATNVLHATRDVHETLKNARTLLAPGGLLVLNELTHAQAWLDISFGMTEGWWRFSDSALRKYHPLLSAVQWRSVVEASGCEEFTLLQDEPDPAAAVMVARVPATSVRKEPCTRWLLLSDDAIGVPLASALSAIGRHCTMMRPNASAEHISNALAVLAVDGVDELSVVYVCTGDTDWRSALTLTQTLVNAGVPRLRLWFVTRSAVGVDGLCPEAGLSQATLWGLARVIALEHPELDCRMIDIDATSTPTAIQQLVAELTSSSLENQVVWRGARRRVARLALATSNVQPAAFRDNASYLIAGGLGGLGLLIARWMVERGARELVLCGSSEPTVAQLSEIKRIEALGAHVTAYRADITDGAQVDKMLSKIQCTLPPLRGVINAAGILRDAVLARQDENGFRAVLSPKIDGTWNLHRATLNCPLDFFVLFSSIVALLGNPGQANHAAANAFEDSFAHYRHALGLPALSINWGVWTEVGAAAARGFDSKLEASSTGLKSISPQIGLAAFERVLFSNSVQVVVTTADWSKMAQTYPHMRSFLQDVCSQATAREENKNTARASLRRQWECAPPQERRGLLQQRIRELLATVLGLDSPALIESDQVFANLGFDSLVAIDFRNRLANALGHALPSTTLFDYPTLDKLTGFIVAEVFGLTIDHENRTSSTRTQDKRTMLDVASLSEDQAEAMLLEELKRG